jgi:hypothetical protein
MSLNSATFESEFLEKYLRLGLGSLPKSDIDALVMSLLERYGFDGSGPLSKQSNQTVSELLRTPLAKVKKLRYEAALKFGGPVEEEAKGRLLAALASASIETQQDQIRIIIEDSLAKNWLQGQLKLSQHIFDHSFNTEIITVSAEGMFQVLEKLFEVSEVKTFKDGYDKAKSIVDTNARNKFFKKIALKFVEGAAKAGGIAVVTALKAHLS